MKKLTLTILLLSLSFSLLTAQTGYVPTEANLQSRQEFEQARFGIFIHWGIYSMLGDGEWAMQVQGMPADEYSRLAAGFCPSKFDAAAWVSAFKAAGAKYMTITTRHHDGFSMFGTKASPYNVVDATPFGRDVIGELAEECHKQGLRLHFYYSQLDWYREDYFPLGNTGHSSGRKNRNGELGTLDDYFKFMDAQLTELLTNYGKIGAIWYDGIWDRENEPGGRTPERWNLFHQYELIHSLQDGCLVGSNHHMNPFPGEDIQIFERDIPGQNTAGYSTGMEVSQQLPLETCQTMNGSWGYRLMDTGYKSTDDLIRYLVQTAGKGANLLLNIGPRPDGTLPEAALERLEGMGRWLDKYGETIYATKGGYIPAHSWGVTTQKDNRLFVHILKAEDRTIVLPANGNKVTACVDFINKEKVSFKQDKENIYITLDAIPSEVDHVVEITFKNNL